MKHVPNLLSAARLVLAPLLFFLLWRRSYSAALVLFVAAGVSDGLDGLLARRFAAGSRLGEYLDPVADKILLSGTFLTLALDGAIERWIAVVVLGRDVLILLFAVGGLLFTASLRRFPPSQWGKASTLVQIAFVVAVVAHLAGFASAPLVLPLQWLTVALTAWSGVDYAWRGISLVRRVPT